MAIYTYLILSAMQKIAKTPQKTLIKYFTADNTISLEDDINDFAKTHNIVNSTLLVKAIKKTYNNESYYIATVTYIK